MIKTVLWSIIVISMIAYVGAVAYAIHKDRKHKANVARRRMENMERRRRETWQ